MPKLKGAQRLRMPLSDAGWTVLGLLLLLAWDSGELDLPLSRLFGNATGFAWRDHWLTAGLMHDGVRVAAWLIFGVLLLSVWWPMPFARTLVRHERVWWAATTLACAALISLLKHASSTSCPWSLAEFGGGYAHYVSHWALGLRDGGPGRCFPSGHAATALAFLPGWFVLRGSAPRAARAWLTVTLGVGLACGWTQMMRGAHYASHSMWTAWLCWSFSALSWHTCRLMTWQRGDQVLAQERLA